jgi:hypothetical protein
MKHVMAKESTSRDQGVASFEYSPADARFPMLFELSRPLDELEGMLKRDFIGKTVSFKAMYESHSVGRRFIDSNYKQVLIDLEDRSLITAVKSDGSKRRKHSFADNVLITFSSARN